MLPERHMPFTVVTVNVQILSKRMLYSRNMIDSFTRLFLLLFVHASVARGRVRYVSQMFPIRRVFSAHFLWPQLNFATRMHNLHNRELDSRGYHWCVQPCRHNIPACYGRTHRPIYCESKKGATLIMAITLSILDRFAKFFHWCKEQ